MPFDSAGPLAASPQLPSFALRRGVRSPRASGRSRSACRPASAPRRSARSSRRSPRCAIARRDRPARRDRRRLARRHRAGSPPRPARRSSRRRELMPDYGPVAGKGDAMWRALSVLDGELVCFLDADVLEFSGALRDRAARSADRVRRGRLRQGVLPPAVPPRRHRSSPTAAAASTTCSRARRWRSSIRRSPACASRSRARSRRAASLLELLPFATGYGVEIAMLLDVLEQVGLDGHGPGRPRPHHNSHQPLLDAQRDGLRRAQACSPLRLERDGRLLELDAAPLLLDECAVRRAAGRAPADGQRDGERRALRRPRRHAARTRRVAAARRRGRGLAARGARDRGLPARRRRGRADERAPPRPGRRGRAPARPARVHLRGRLRARARRRAASG